MSLKQCVFLGFFLINTSVFAQKASNLRNEADSNMVKQLFFAGLREKMNENYVVASNNFSKIVSLDPKNDVAYFELATTNVRMDKFKEAEINVKQAIKINGDNKWYWILLSELQKRNNNMPELIVTLNQLIKLDPARDAYYFDRANAQFISNKIEDAQKTYDEIETKFGLSPDLTQARERLSNVKNADQDGSIITPNNSKADNDYYVKLATAQLLNKNREEAIDILQKAVFEVPEHFEVNLALASIYFIQGYDDLSVATLKQAIENPKIPLDDKIELIVSLFPKVKDTEFVGRLTEISKLLTNISPTEAKVFALYGNILYQQNNLKEALPQYLSALKLNSKIYSVWEAVIEIQTALGNYKEALKTCNEALSIYPNQASLYYYNGFALFKTGKTDLALSNLDSALQLDTENKLHQSQVYQLKGDIYINQKNFHAAKLAFEKAIDLDANNYLVMNNYAYYLALRNDELLKAEKFAKIAANAVTTSASFADTYAFVLFKLQKYDLAQQWIEKAIQNISTRNDVYFERYGDILYMQGNKDGALQQWQKAKELGNESQILNKKINEKKYIK
ncbi:tetratricopeptide repeat protein [Pedobacter changchengzhani]|uniref:Tetratricopeptide repeat protein n=1 Tax=Pedobacter changchengzhani TaxID=2529274 RepID=A0A4V3A0J1_9SPHI|nr:tetratricopeptide repeat protein [Pedobacter changchengzhani]TDG37743.1 tetratricopeptide repeat protein [Pedobacter changchengzhani]